MTGDTSVPNALHAEATTVASAPASACAPAAASADVNSDTSNTTDTTANEMDGRPPRPAKPDPERVRLCIVTRQELPPAEMIRFVAGPDGTIVPDLARRLPGRGMWVTATRAALQEATKRNLFAKSLKKAVKIDKALVEQVEILLANEARQALSLANKAGLVTTGFSKVEIALEKNQVAALFASSDASSDGAGKLARKFKAIRGASQQDAPIIQDFSSAELSLAIGGSNVIHAGLAGGRLGQRVVTCCQRLRHFRMQANDTIAADVGDASDFDAQVALSATPETQVAPAATPMTQVAHTETQATQVARTATQTENAPDK